MKNIILLLSLFFASKLAFAVCNTPISRTNFSTLQVLTSTRLNTELNTVYSQVNELPGDCILDESVTSSKIDDGTLVAADMSASIYGSIAPKIYYNLLQVSGFVVTDQTDVAPYIFGASTLTTGTAVTTGIQTISVIYLDPAAYPTSGTYNPKLRITGNVAVNDAAPGVTISIGLYPLTRPGTSGASGNVIFTVGTVVSGSNATFTTPAADSSTSATGTSFSIPSAGFYALGVRLSAGTGIVAANSTSLVNSRLQLVYE